MSELAYSSTRMLLINNTNVTNYVPVGNIRLGFTRENVKDPSVSMTLVGGGTWAYLGQGTSVVGSKTRRESRLFQLDIYTSSGMRHLQTIGDGIDTALISGTGYRKLNDNDVFENGLQMYRKIQTWSSWVNVND